MFITNLQSSSAVSECSRFNSSPDFCAWRLGGRHSEHHTITENIQYMLRLRLHKKLRFCKMRHACISAIAMTKQRVNTAQLVWCPPSYRNLTCSTLSVGKGYGWSYKCLDIRKIYQVLVLHKKLNHERCNYTDAVEAIEL